jgi:creatinine amidohydrolase
MKEVVGIQTQYDVTMINKHIPKEPVPDEVRAPLLRPGELLARLDAFPVAFAPLGTLEWHARQNPIGCDALKAEALCSAAAKIIGGVVMPPLFFAMDAYWDGGKGLGYGMDPAAGFVLPGSFYRTEPALFVAILENACRNYLARGFKLVVLLSGHNPPIQINMMNEVCVKFKTAEGREPVTALFEFSTMDKNDPLKIPDHAGFYETSLMMHITGRVNMEINAGQDIPELALSTNRPLNEASAENGAAIFNNQVETLCKYIQRKFDELRES